MRVTQVSFHVITHHAHASVIAWLLKIQGFFFFTHVVGQSYQRDAICRQKDVALGKLTALPRGLVNEQTLNSYQPWPLVARINSASHTESQALTALQ